MASAVIPPRQLAPTMGLVVALAGFHPDGTFFINSVELLGPDSVVRLSGRLRQPLHRRCWCGVFAVFREARRLDVAIASARSHLLPQHQRLQQIPGTAVSVPSLLLCPVVLHRCFHRCHAPGRPRPCVSGTHCMRARPRAARRRSGCGRVPRMPYTGVSETSWLIRVSHLKKAAAEIHACRLSVHAE